MSLQSKISFIDKIPRFLQFPFGESRSRKFHRRDFLVQVLEPQKSWSFTKKKEFLFLNLAIPDVNFEILAVSHLVFFVSFVLDEVVLTSPRAMSMACRLEFLRSGAPDVSTKLGSKSWNVSSMLFFPSLDLTTFSKPNKSTFQKISYLPTRFFTCFFSPHKTPKQTP